MADKIGEEYDGIVSGVQPFGLFVELNDWFVEGLIAIAAIAFNGTTAASVGRRLVGVPPRKIQLLDLPSSSAANTRSFAEKAAAWARLADFLQP